MVARETFNRRVGRRVRRAVFDDAHSANDDRFIMLGGLNAKAMRAIDFKEGVEIDEGALTELVRAAVPSLRRKEKVTSPQESEP
jgi:hypothetical protein